MIDEAKILEQVDERIRNLGRRVGDHEELKKHISDAKTHVGSLSEKIKTSFDAASKDVSDLRQRCKDLDDKNKSLVFEIDDVRKSNQRLFAEILAGKQDIDALNKKIEDLKAKISESDKKIFNFNSLCLDLKDRFSALNSHMQGLQESLFQQNQKIELNNSKIQDFIKLSANSINLLKEENKQLSGQILKLESADVKLHRQFHKDLDDLDYKCQALFVQFDSKIASIKIPSIDHLASIDTVNKLNRSIELASLDAKNAFLKSNNNEMQNQILTKKIEGLQIALKSHELGNAK